MKKEKEDKLVKDEEIRLNIRDDEIWTYQVEGLSKPHINQKYSHYTLKKVVFTVVIVIAVSLSIFFSTQVLQNDTFEYDKTDTGYEFTKFSNTGYITELDIDYVSELVYDRENPDPETNFSIKKDSSAKITSVGKYVLNCDEKVQIINIGADVTYVDPKAFYSCWALREVRVDEANPNYCDIEGVLYNKDKTELIFRPCDHDTYLAEKYGWAEYDSNGIRLEPASDSENYAQYEKDVLTYVVPSSVKTIGELSFNYANMTTVYLPEGLTSIETLGFFEIPLLKNVMSYKTEKDITDTHFTSEDALGEVYISLPEGLEYIGSDAFSYNQQLTYMYIPESVTFIGHHAFWDTLYKDDDTGELVGLLQINVAVSEEEFKDKVKTGDNWKPQYDYMLFKKSIDAVFDSERIK